MSGLRLIVGLGNPGPEHARTRHNAGFWFIDALARQAGARFGLDSKLFGETAKADIGRSSISVVSRCLRSVLMKRLRRMRCIQAAKLVPGVKLSCAASAFATAS